MPPKLAARKDAPPLFVLAELATRYTVILPLPEVGLILCTRCAGYSTRNFPGAGVGGVGMVRED